MQKPKDKLVDFTTAEELWIRNHKTIRVGMSPVLPPLKFSDKGVIKGIEPDYLNLLSEYTGIQFEYIICDFSVMDGKVKSGEIDMFLSFIIPERLSYMTFTEPFMEFKSVIVTRSETPFTSGISSFNGKKMATVKGVKLYDKILSPYPEVEAVPVNTMEEMFKTVSEAKADALITKTYLAGYVMQNYPNLKIAGVLDLPPDPYLYAVRKDYPELVGILNKAIEAIPKDRFDAIVQKWFTIRLEYRPNWSEIRKWAFAVGVVFTLILGLTLFWNRRLAREIEKRKKTEVALRETQAILQAAMDQSQAGIAIADAPGGTLRYVNDAGLLIRGGDRQSVVNGVGVDQYVASWQLMDFDGRPLKPDEVPLARAIMFGETGSREFIIRRSIDDDRIVLAKAAPIMDDSGKVVAGIVVFMDITDRKRAEEALRESEERYRELSIIDGLTQLHNSRHFYHQLNTEIERTGRYGQPLTLMRLDLDDFKNFNDVYGHIEGDQVLMRLGQVIKRCLRQTDSAYRYGGEEFTIILPMTTSADGAVTAQRIRMEFKNEIFSPAPGQDVHVTVSIGIGQYKPLEDMKAFVHRVDQFMYLAKKAGKDRVCSES
ncbi:MAG: diguanylate cyclase [Rectinemataceae bacterium]|nr:diguanylate cyclase [Rectinemataceae bacterium]